MKCIKKFDFLSYKISLRINKKGHTRYKTFIGGLISILTYLISISFCIYFLLRMLNRKDLSIIHSTHQNPFINITFSNKLPFLLRISDTNSIPYKDDEKLYYIKSSIWYGGSNNTSISGSASQYSVSLNISKCNLNTHFTKEFKNYFENFQNLDSYYCLEPRNYSQTIYGIYGSYYPFSYYSFTLKYCENTTENNNSCYSLEDIKNKIYSPFLDVIFIDYTINNLNKKNVREISIRKERYELSLLLYKRIWIYLENIKYITDNGYIFTNNKEENFFRFETVRIDPSLLEGQKTYFTTLSIGNYAKTSIYNKYYTKFQDYIATIGGLIKIIVLCGKILNYFNSKNSYYFKIMKNLNIDNYINYIEHSKKQSINFTSNIFGKSTANLQENNIENTKNDFGFLNINNKNVSYNLTRKSISVKILPSIFINKEAKSILKMYKQFINNRLNVINIIKKLEVIQSPEIIKHTFSQNKIDNNHLQIINSKINNNYLCKKDIT
jgi:hypothetical protein